MSRPEYRGYDLDTLLRARTSAHMVVNDVVQVAVTPQWVARSAPGVVGAWYGDGSHATDGDAYAFVNSRYRPGWAFLKGCQNYADRHLQVEADALEVSAQTEDRVQLTDALHRITYALHRRHYDAFVAEGDVLLAVNNPEKPEHGMAGTRILVVRNGVVMAAVRAETPSTAVRQKALDSGLLPQVYSIPD